MSDLAVDRSGRDATGAIELAKTAAQTMMLINGGAAVGLLTFLSRGKPHIDFLILTALLLYGVGAMSGAITMIFMWVGAEGWAEYWAGVELENKGMQEEGSRQGFAYRKRGMYSFVLSAVAFGAGSVVAGFGLRAKAVDLAPHLPAGYYSLGVALAEHGDLAGAEEKLKDANQRGPHWADPLKAWGDVLAKQGKPKEALAKYDKTLKYAPNWKQLKEAREAVASKRA